MKNRNLKHLAVLAGLLVMASCPVARAEVTNETRVYYAPVTNTLSVADDLVEVKLDYAERLLEQNYLAASMAVLIDTLRVLNRRVLVLSECDRVEFTSSKTEWKEAK